MLFDVDWNPAVDAQAMARIHRDGQKRPCIIYRLLVAGALDEKIWQRQVTKLGLADSVMEKKKGTAAFTREELRDLFRLDERKQSCQTHDLIGCQCGGRGLPAAAIEETEPVAEVGVVDDSDDDLPAVSELLQKASEVNMAVQEQKLRETAAAKRNTKDVKNMQSLMTYTHIDTALLWAGEGGQHADPEVDAEAEAEDMRSVIHDDVLLRVLECEDGERSRVSFAFTRTTGG